MEGILALPDPQRRFRIDLAALRTALRHPILIDTYRVHKADIIHCTFSHNLDREAPVKHC